MNLHRPSHRELEALEALRAHRRAHREGLPTRITQHVEQPEGVLTVGQKISDAVAKTVGSWKFIIFQSVCITGWIAYNTTTSGSAWDPYPFILLNLMLSFQAAYTAPVIMMSQNRQAQKDRLAAAMDYEVNLKSEAELAALHDKVDRLQAQIAELVALQRGDRAGGPDRLAA